MNFTRISGKTYLHAVVILVGVLAYARPVSALPIDFSQNLITVVQDTAVDFSFSQDGFLEGAVVTGTFTGTDLDADSQLSSFTGEISGFSMTFSGNSLVPAFGLGIAHLFGLVYDLDGGPLGDGLALDIEGILAFDVSLGVGYIAGPGPFDVCGIGVDCAAVGAIPEPGVAALCAMGLAALLRRRARRP